MRILVVGSARNHDEFRSKFPDLEATFLDDHDFNDDQLSGAEVVFDFLAGDEPQCLENYQDHQQLVVMCNSAKTSLSEMIYYQEGVACTVYGFNGMPTFFDRPLLEVTLPKGAGKEKLVELCNELGIEFEIVEDRVGLVSARVICMIINEAYYTVQEGTATREDIDAAMKLGTNYPMGPFEWCEKIGLENVFELLEAVYEDTKEERYKICPLLKKEYMAVGS